MTVKKTLSFVLALMMIASAAAIASAESPEATAGEPVAESAAEVPVYTLDEMLRMAMSDAYARQAAYAACAEAFPDSRAITGADMDTQIVLLEMLLKANGAALPAKAADVTAPETEADAYAALAATEREAVTMYRSFLRQESLPKDARIIFRSVLQPIGRNAQAFARKAQSAMWAAQWKEAMETGETQVYEFDNGRGHGTLTVYTYSSDQGGEPDTEPDETTEPAEEPDVEQEIPAAE